MKWKSIFKEAAFISSIHLSTKILGFFEKLLIAYLFGTSSISDAYFFSFAIFILLFDFFNESTSPALLPSYVKAREEQQQRSLLNSAFSYLSLAGIIISLLISLFADAIINNFTGFPPQTADIATDYLRIISLGIGFVIASISTYLYINSGKKFLPASLGDLFFKITGTLFFLYAIIDRSIGLIPLAVGILAGSVIKLATHIIYLKRTNNSIRLNFETGFLSVFKKSLPVIAGVLFAKGRILFDNLIVSGMAIGSVTAMQLGYRVMEFSIVVLLEPFSTVLFPEFVSMTGDRKALSEKVRRSVKLMLSLFIPASFFAFVFRHEIIALLFKRGEFDEKSVILTASAFSFYVLSMIFICLDFLFSRALFSFGDTKFPPLFEIVSITFHILFVLIFRSRGLFIVSLAFLLNRIIKSLLLFIKLNKIIEIKSGMVKFLFKVSASVFSAAFISFIVNNYIFSEMQGIPAFLITGVSFFLFTLSGFFLTGIIRDFRLFLKN